MPAAVLTQMVALGVAAGFAVGVLKIIYSIDIIYLLFGGYAVSIVLSACASEAMVNVAWDSAGVTTGPVTVPFVLSIGIAFGNTINAPEGFGILACGTFCPINAVLLSDAFLRLRAKWKAYRASRLVSKDSQHALQPHPRAITVRTVRSSSDVDDSALEMHVIRTTPLPDHEHHPRVTSAGTADVTRTA